MHMPCTHIGLQCVVDDHESVAVRLGRGRVGVGVGVGLADNPREGVLE